MAQLLPAAETKARDLSLFFDDILVDAMHAVLPRAHEVFLSLCRRYFGCGASVFGLRPPSLPDNTLMLCSGCLPQCLWVLLVAGRWKHRVFGVLLVAGLWKQSVFGTLQRTIGCNLFDECRPSTPCIRMVVGREK